MKTFSAVSLAAAALCSVLAGPALAAKLDLKPSLSANYDALWVDEDQRNFPDASAWRRARVGLNVRYGERWLLRGEHDLADRTAPELSLQVFLGSGRHLRFGQFKHPFLLDDVINERQTPLMEQSLATAYAISRRLGVAYGQANEQHSFDVSLFDKRLDGRFEGSGMALRYSRVLQRSAEGLLHLGGSFAVDEPRAGITRFSTRPESGIASVSLVDTGSFANVRQNQRAAAELLWLQGPWSVQAEHAIGRSQRRGLPDFDSDASYALLSFSPTGHARGYRNGVVGSPRFASGERPVELFLRYSRIDLDDAPVRGGRQQDWTAGITWYLHPNVRVLGNYTLADSQRRGLEDAPELLQLRLQLSY